VAESGESKGQSASRERLDAFIAALKARPRPVLVVKKSTYWHQHVIGALLWLITLGGQRRYMTRYTTTLGHTIYMPDELLDKHPDSALITLRHELVHIAQFERYGWLGMVFLYGFFPLPVFLAYGRARLEWEAYRETLRAVAEVRGMKSARRPRRHRILIRRFTGPDYFWMWPFPRMIQRWIDEALAEIERELGSR
jgi:hypothetical protein